ncbi:hypothetical protein [Mucilaginibacter sp. BT774]|uniref:hypothetical protein n=1 Tax=Mucilaginibacter sp. BT774 TaxID=3062276 RepID=UPI002675B6C3|nr:hypothetical protein [Mucilaginibacter sp. BT774]MDO3626070.1 hypothetical protein [Mucilaginibacter sp. BT774]
MTRAYPLKLFLRISVVLLLFVLASCSKDSKKSNTNITPTQATPTKFGLYEADSSIYKLVYTFVTKIGTQDVTSADYDLLFDTGSGGLVFDAHGIIPSSMITSNGITFSGDSTVVNGITIYNQKATISYGDDTNTTANVYGYLAYAPVTLGEANNGGITIKRLPFLLYYKAADTKGNVYADHEFDVLGVSSEYDTTFPNNAYITSPFAYFDPGEGLLKGFKMDALGTNNFSLNGTYVPGAVTLGLTSSDLSSYTMHQLTYYPGDGYAPIIPVSLTYNGKTFTTNTIFDTGTEPYSYIQDPTAGSSAVLLPANTPVSLTTTPGGFTYSYATSAADNITYVENPAQSGSNVTVMSLEFFLNNGFMLDYYDHKLGLKNN